MKFPYIVAAKFLSRFSKNRHEYMSNYFRSLGMNVGKNCNILSNLSIAEPYLICLGDNVTISSDVLILTHDASIGKVLGKENGSELMGKVIIGDNCFIGARSVILPGVTLANNIIVAAGSVVTHSVVDERIIIGGNPARCIGTWEQFRIKHENQAFSLHGIKGDSARYIVENQQEKLIKKGSKRHEQ